MSELKLEGLHKAFGEVKVLHDINLEVRDREFVVLVGPSGCGKSTLLRLMAGLEQISQGELVIDGERMNDVPAARRGLAMVFQSYALYPHMTVAENMSVGLRISGVKKDVIRQKVADAAETLQLTEYLERKPKQLSGGQRQRVAIGRAIVRNPKIFLFDEPLSNLDAALRLQMRLELAKLHRNLNATMIYVTHDQVEAMTLADKIVVMNAGRIEQIGSPLDLYRKPANLFVAGFLGSPKMNIFHGTVAAVGDQQATVRLDEVDATVDVPRSSLEIGQPVSIGLRPEDVETARNGEPSANRLKISASVVERLGGRTYAYAEFGEGGTVTVEFDGVSAVEPGDDMEIGLPLNKLHLFDDDGLSLN